MPDLLFLSEAKPAPRMFIRKCRDEVKCLVFQSLHKETAKVLKRIF